MLQTLRPALRGLVRRPAFTAVAILTLALGIGANVAIFSVVDAVLLRPLPYEDPSRLVIVWQHSAEAQQRLGFDRMPISGGDYTDFREGNTSFERLAAMRADRITLTEGEAERLGGIRVSEEFFDTLGVHAAVGRTFRADDAPRGRVVVISHAFWTRRFGADPLIPGRVISINGAPAVVTGVMPPGFSFPAAGDLPDAFGFTTTPDVWTLDIPTPEQRISRGGKSRVLIGRLRPGATVASADADLNAIGDRIAQEHPASNAGWTVRVLPLREQLVAHVRPALLVLLTGVGVVLLIACANVANLLLLRATTRQRELTVRLALGASRRRLILELLAESVLLALTAGAAGLVLASWTLNLLIHAAPATLPAVASAALDGRVLLFALAVSIVTGILFGTLPAFQATSTKIAEGLSDGSRGAVGGRRAHRLRSTLVVVEVALAVMLLVGTALLVQAFVRLTRVDAGFNPERVLTMELALPQATYSQPQARAFYADLVERLTAIPGIESAGLSSGLPLTGYEHLTIVTIEGAPKPDPGQELLADRQVVTNGYFPALAIPLQMGSFLPQPSGPDAPRYVLVSQRLARSAWPGQDPVGRRLKMVHYDADAPWHIVAGVVADTRNTGLDVALRPQVFVHHAQYSDWQMAVVMRTSGDPMSLGPSARAAVAALDPAQPVSRLRPMTAVVDASIAGRRFHLFIITAFAMLAVSLAMIGLYAVIAYSVAERIREMGVRLALGARPASLLKLVLSEGMRLVAIGILIGVAGAAALTRLLESQLFGIATHDPATFLLVPGALALVGLIGCLLPAVRAMRVDPATALRSE